MEEKNKISAELEIQGQNLPSKRTQDLEVIGKFGPVFQIDWYFCDGCGLCATVCPADIILIKNFLAIVPDENSASCYECGSCMSVCLKDAIFRI